MFQTCIFYCIYLFCHDHVLYHIHSNLSCTTFNHVLILSQYTVSFQFQHCTKTLQNTNNVEFLSGFCWGGWLLRPSDSVQEWNLNWTYRSILWLRKWALTLVVWRYQVKAMKSITHDHLIMLNIFVSSFIQIVSEGQKQQQQTGWEKLGIKLF